MAETQYGFVDTGDVIFVPPSNNATISEQYSEVMHKINSLTKDAPTELDTFAEVAEEVKSLSKRLDTVESGGVEHGEYAKKTDLEEYAKRTELDSYYTRTEIPVVLSEYTNSDELHDKITSVIDETIDVIELEEINEFFNN